MEGILLDPVYTGKAAAALLEYSANNKFGKVLYCSSTPGETQGYIINHVRDIGKNLTRATGL